MSLRIAHLCHDPLPHTSTSTEQVVRACAGLAALGVTVDLFFAGSGPPPQHAAQPGAADREAVAEAYGFATGLPDGLRLVPVPGVPALRGGAGIGAWEVRAARLARRGGYDLVLTRDLAALAWSLGGGSRAVFETYRADLQTSPWLWPWRRFCYCRPNLAGVITHSALTARAVVAAGVDERKVLVAMNGHASEHLQPRLGRDEARAILGLPGGRPLVVYAGHVGPRKGFAALAALAASVPEATFLAVGAEPGSAEERDARRAAARSGAGNVSVLPRVPPARVPAYLFAADCLLIPPSAAPLVRHGRTVLPMKTFLYLGAGRPILAPDLPDVREVLTDGRTALLVPPDDVPAAAAALRRLLSDAALQAGLSAGALEAASLYTWDARSSRVKAFLEGMSAAPAIER
ncbi:MAG: glycosyl transferase group 1 [Acidobacteria bacterium]|nr:glycosyl transferase group 1 [Acidobacteriota bacterium]